MNMEKQRNYTLGAAVGLGALCFWDKGRQTIKSWIGIEEKIHVTVETDEETSTETV